MSSEFKTFLKQKQEEPVKKSVDWELQKNKWIGHVNQLYKYIEEWLTEYKSESLLEVTYSNIEITEEEIGTYDIRALQISVGSNIIHIEPVGTLLIGAWGRVNITGKSKISESLILMPVEVRSLHDTIKVTTNTSHDSAEIKGEISIGSTIQNEDNYPNLEWKYLDKNTGALSEINKNLFENILKTILD